MTYLDEISKDFHYILSKYECGRKNLAKKSKVRRLAKLRRYIARVRGEPVSTQKWMEYIFSGRLNRTPWKCKGLPYVAKAKRRPYPFATGGYVNHLEFPIAFPKGVVIGVVTK